uniref:26S proteasome complex subunit dss-1 n=1 Tax=Panagrolaimus superbus TaxID=310955 RepID=A0A914Y4I0_9BILA
MSSNQDKSEKSDKSDKTTPKKMSFSLNNPNDPKPSAAANKNIVALDDDDEFEEFPLHAGHIEPVEEDEKDTIWEDNWEDETVGEDFSTELRAELEKMGHKAVI